MRLKNPNILPPPIDFGAPAKFSEWRAEQVDAIMRGTDTNKRWMCYNMPTGSGKSVTAVMMGRMMGVRTLVLTANKALQDQYFIKDKLSEADVRGQQNYECLAVRPDGPLREYGSRKKTMVDRGPCHVGVNCWMKFNGCGYYDAIRFSQDQQVVTANYDLWLAFGKSILKHQMEEPLGKFGLIVLDEAHAAVDKTCEALRIELPKGELSGLLNVRTLPLSSGVEQWRNWADFTVQKWGDEMDRVTTALRGQYIDADVVEEFKVMQRLGDALDQVSKLQGDWVVGENWKGTHVTFDPVWPAPYTEQLLFRGVPKILMLSATIAPKTVQVMGVPKNECDYVEYPSTFPLAHRPVYVVTGDRSLVPAVDFRMDAEGEKQWIWLIDRIIGPRAELGWKGIIHCVSYARMKRILKLSKYAELFIVNEDSKGTRDAIEDFRASSQSWLVSPSVSTGEDFPDDQCRTIIVPKLPFIDSRDPVARRRDAEDKDWSGSKMMTTFCQSAGRHVRSPKDWGETFVVDGHAKWALPKYKQHAPKYFRDAWQWVYGIPAPLEVE